MGPMAAVVAVNSVARCGGLHLLMRWHRPQVRHILLPTAATGLTGRRTPCLKLSEGRGGALRLCTASHVEAETAAVAVVNSNSGAAVKESEPGETEETRKNKIKEAADLLDIRVGQILKAWKHEEADSLYVEEVDIGEPEPRIICSGLVNYVPLDQLQGASVIVLANLKPRNMRGVKSSGMLMAASDASHKNVELLVPPEGSLPGERIWFGSEDGKENQLPPATPSQVQKKKIWEVVQPHLKTDASGNAVLDDYFMRTSMGIVVSRSLKNANVS